MCCGLSGISSLFFFSNLGPQYNCNSVTITDTRTSRGAYKHISKSIFIHPFYHLKERRLHSRSRSKSGRGAGRRGCPGLRSVDTRMLPAQIIAAGKSPPPHHPLIRGGNLGETRTPRPVRHRGKHEVFDDNTESSLAPTTRFLRENFAASLPFFSLSVSELVGGIPRVSFRGKKKNPPLRRTPAARKKVKIKVLETQRRRKGKFPDVFCARLERLINGLSSRACLTWWEIWIILESAAKILKALAVRVEILASLRKTNVEIRNCY